MTVFGHISHSDTFHNASRFTSLFVSPVFIFFQTFPKAFLRDQKKVKEFECRDDDVWVASFPKTGEQRKKLNRDQDVK